MIGELFDMIATNGIWAALFFFLLVLEIKDSRKREDKYQETVSRLTKELNIVEVIDENVDEVMRRMNDMDRGCSGEEI